MSRSTDWEGRALAVTCWFCSAKAGDRCRTTGGQARFPHAQRQLDAALAEQREEEEAKRREAMIEVIEHYELRDSEGDEINPDLSDNGGLISALYDAAHGKPWEPAAGATSRADREDTA
jgi:hypothetical protein